MKKLSNHLTHDWPSQCARRTFPWPEIPPSQPSFQVTCIPAPCKTSLAKVASLWQKLNKIHTRPRIAYSTFKWKAHLPHRLPASVGSPQHSQGNLWKRLFKTLVRRSKHSLELFLTRRRLFALLGERQRYSPQLRCCLNTYLLFRNQSWESMERKSKIKSFLDENN